MGRTKKPKNLFKKYFKPTIDFKQQIEKLKGTYRPWIVPRYLPGSVPTDHLKADLRMYNVHRYNIFTALPKIDTSPPLMNPYNYIKLTRLTEDCRRLKRIDLENKELLRKINLIYRHGGKVDTFNTKVYDRSFSKWNEHEFEALRIVRENKSIYKRILNAKSMYSKKSHDEFWTETFSKLKNRCKYPLVIFDKINYDMEILQKQKSITELTLSTSESARVAHRRPLCYMTLKVDHGMTIGTIFIELYTDFVPVTCQNFLTLCKQQAPDITYRNSLIHNIVKHEYIEFGDITLGNGKGGKSIYGDKFAEENFRLTHSRAGALSMTPVGNHENNSMFLISLHPLPKFNGKRVVFGRVVKGFEHLLTVSEMLTRKIGKPSTPIRIINCGECSRKVSKKLSTLIHQIKKK